MIIYDNLCMRLVSCNFFYLDNDRGERSDAALRHSVSDVSSVINSTFCTYLCGFWRVCIFTLLRQPKWLTTGAYCVAYCHLYVASVSIAFFLIKQLTGDICILQKSVYILRLFLCEERIRVWINFCISLPAGLLSEQLVIAKTKKKQREL